MWGLNKGFSRRVNERAKGSKVLVLEGGGVRAGGSGRCQCDAREGLGTVREGERVGPRVQGA